MTPLAYVSGSGASYLSLWVVIPGIAFIALIAAFGLWAMATEINPDPGWRKREAEIFRLEQEKRLRELRAELGEDQPNVRPSP
jgi:hypothetical protein